jgi:hypothetical protein
VQAIEQRAEAGVARVPCCGCAESAEQPEPRLPGLLQGDDLAVQLASLPRSSAG